MKKKILVTGSSGFIGKNLLPRLLKKRNKIFAILKESKVNKQLSKKINLNYNNFYPIFFKKNKELNSKLNKINIDVVVNLATKYIKNHDFTGMLEMINSNILFNTAVLESLSKKKLKNFINLNSMMLHKESNNYRPMNLYAASKKGFLDILKFYKDKYKKVKFQNLTIYDTYGSGDNRVKMIPQIIKKYKSNKTIIIASKKLELNLLNVIDVCKAIEIMIEKKIPPGDYKIMSKKFTNICTLVQKTNKNLKKKIKYKITKVKIDKKIKIKTKILPFWKQTRSIENDFLNYIYENTKNKI